MTNKQIN